MIGDWLGEYDDDYNDVYDECEPSGMVAEAGETMTRPPIGRKKDFFFTFIINLHYVLK